MRIFERLGHLIFIFKPATLFCYQEIFGMTTNNNAEIQKFIAQGRNIVDQFEDILSPTQNVEFIIQNEYCPDCHQRLSLNEAFKFAIAYSDEKFKLNFQTLFYLFQKVNLKKNCSKRVGSVLDRKGACMIKI